MSVAHTRAGFTVVELLLVIIILGVLAVIALPRITDQSQAAKQAALEQNLAIMNEAIERYKLDHDGTYPGTISGGTSWENFVTHMTLQTDKAGKPGTRYGPYLRTGIPQNPFTNTNAGCIDRGEQILVRFAWYYRPQDGIISASAASPGEGLEDGQREQEPQIPIIN